ncbi:hypothetical protein NMP99_01395 [Glutamicibacter mishrai]|uniref:hypothetical protein n=1 Tax=Glutamicibacter mishrai TaxID=1775880 RepID=UPI0020CF2009|nr:hypothetical protein [Glutamicibacter mishrai]UTT39994.1 hypothetical protein NMP99_01395 [Glutamicibacter mishrai]
MDTLHNWHAITMAFSLPDDTETGEHLKRGPLRDFGPRKPDDSYASKRHTLSFHDFPVPRLLAYSLRISGFKTGGPGEKVEWWARFTYKGIGASLAHEKFGLRLYLPADLTENARIELLTEIQTQLRSAVRAVEKVLLARAPEMLGQGHATVVNQHFSLERAYAYFRSRALDPALIDDEYKVYGADELPKGLASASTFQDGKVLMQLNAFHDMIAAITAYLSRLEHDLVLAFAFSNFDPDSDNLTSFIGSRWGEKFNRVLNTVSGSHQYRSQLTAVVERWRNPYSHGGFEKGHAATIYLHTPGVGAVPVGLTKVRESPLFSFVPATESTIQEVFHLFDELDAWMQSQLPEAIQWIRSGLDVRFDPDFRSLVEEALESDKFEELVSHFEHRQAIADNMDY